MNTIVVGVDGSPQSQDAVSFAGRLAGATGARLRLVCAYRYSSPAGGAEVPIERTALREEAQATLTRARAALDAAADVETQTIADPSPARALHDVATRCRAGLIVVGSSHTGRAGRVFPGSTAEHLLHGSPTSVVVVPKGWRARPAAGLAPVGVASDGSPESGVAAAAAVAAARAANAPLHVIHVRDGGNHPAATGPAGVAAELGGAVADGIEVTHVLRSGPAASELVAASEGLGVLFMGSRGYGPLRAVLVGGTSGAVVRDAFCPVLVTPRGAKIDTALAGAAAVG